MAGFAYQLNGSLARVLYAEGERSLEPRLGFSEHEESLVRAFGLGALLSREGHFERARVAQHHSLLDAGSRRKPIDD